MIIPLLFFFIDLGTKIEHSCVYNANRKREAALTAEMRICKKDKRK